MPNTSDGDSLLAPDVPAPRTGSLINPCLTIPSAKSTATALIASLCVARSSYLFFSATGIASPGSLKFFPAGIPGTICCRLSEYIQLIT